MFSSPKTNDLLETDNMTKNGRRGIFNGNQERLPNARES